MILKAQKRLAASVLKVSPKRVKFDTDKLTEIKEAITKADIRGLVIDHFAVKKPVKNTSRSRIRKRSLQRTKRRQKGSGSRKGKNTARLPKKKKWMVSVRSQRVLLRELKTKGLITSSDYRLLYRKTSGGYFRNRRHIKGYIAEKNLLTKK